MWYSTAVSCCKMGNTRYYYTGTHVHASLRILHHKRPPTELPRLSKLLEKPGLHTLTDAGVSCVCIHARMQCIISVSLCLRRKFIFISLLRRSLICLGPTSRRKRREKSHHRINLSCHFNYFVSPQPTGAGSQIVGIELKDGGR